MKLLDYIRGLRKGKEAHRLEKESLKDVFLADAMDGYTQVKGNHEKQIEKLRKQITARSTSKKKRYAITWSIAACLVIGSGISSYFLYLKNNLSEDVLITKESIQPTIQAPITPKEIIASAPTRESQKDSVPDTKANLNNRKEIITKVQQTSVPQKNISEQEIAATMDQIDQPKAIAMNAEQIAMKIVRTSEQNNIIKGKVIDEAGEPIIGASVSFKGTNIGTVTNLNGEFSLKMTNTTNELTAQFIGYQSVNIPVDTNKTILIAMREDSRQLSEVVVVGYGSKKKSSMVGSVTAVPAKTKSELRTPQPIIGKREYKKYLKENLVHPTEGECAEVKGTVTLTFFVDQEGKPQHITVTKGLCETADKEAIRLIQEGPKWTVGTLPVEIKVKFR